MKNINFGSGKVSLPGFSNVDYPEIDLNKKLPYQDREFDYGICRSTIVYLQDPKFSIGEMRRVCKKLEVSLPHTSGLTPNQLDYGATPHPHFSLADLYRLKPRNLRVVTYIPFFSFSSTRYSSFMKVWEYFFSGILRARTIWLLFGDEGEDFTFTKYSR